jgi:hypothetical protein
VFIRSTSFALAFAAVIGLPASTRAQTPPQPTTDVGDIWRQVRHVPDPTPDAPDSAADNAEAKPERRFLVVAPTIGSKPTTGLTGGINSNVAFFRGDPKSTHISTLTAGMRVSQKKQVLSGFRLSMFTADDRWYVQGDHRLSWTSQNTYGLGADSMKSDAENVKFKAFRIYESAYKKVRKGLFVGGGLNVSTHTNVRPGDGSLTVFEESDYAAYNVAHGFSASGQTSSGASVGLLYDTRDNGINPQRGWLANSTYRTFYKNFLAGDSTWQELILDVRTYKKITPSGRQKLAFWAMTDLVTGGVAPYLDLPATGSDGRSARGYGDGRYRGTHLAYGEVEYRGTITRNGLLGMVAFANSTTVDNASGEKIFDTWAPAAGLGLRVLLNKHSRTNFAADYAWGKAGATGFYLGIQEAF